MGNFDPKTQEIFFDRQKAIEAGKEGSDVAMAFTMWSDKTRLPVRAVIFRVIYGPIKMIKIIETINEGKHFVGESYLVGTALPPAIAKQAMFHGFITGNEKLPDNVLSVRGGYIALELTSGKKSGQVVKVIATSREMSNYRVGQTWPAKELSIPTEIRDRVTELFPQAFKKKAA